MLDYEVFKLFAVRKRRQYYVAGLALLIVGILYFKEDISFLDFLSEDMSGYIAIGLIIGLLAYSLFNWRCPKCNAYFGREISMKHCRKCGVQLVESRK